MEPNGSMAPLFKQLCYASSSDIVSICKSPLVVHVIYLFLEQKEAISPRSLALLASKAVNLESLFCTLSVDPTYEDQFAFPPKLVFLFLSLPHAPAALINRVLVAVGALRSLESLQLTVPSLAKVDLAPLTRLESLDKLDIKIMPLSEDAPRVDADFSPRQLAALRGLSSLTTLNVGPGLTERSVRKLFAAGHTFRLKDLGHSVFALTLTAELGGLIASLPLERFDVWPSHTLEFLPRLASTLRKLDMQLRDSAVEPDAIAEALSHLTGLTSLSLTGSTLTSAHLTIPMRSLSQLGELCLHSLSQLQSFSFLAEAGAPKLEALTLENCSHSHFSPLELHHLRRSQPQLACLFLINTFNAPLDVFSLSLLEPPSIVLPALAEFDYRFDEPNAEDEEDDQDDGYESYDEYQ